MIHDEESEKCVLSAMINDEQALVESLSELSAEDFYKPEHAAIFTLTQSLFAMSVRPSYIEVAKEGAKTGLLKDSHVIFDIAEYYITSQGLHYWINNLKEKTKLRKLKRILLLASDKFKQNPAADSLIEELGAAIMALQTSRKARIDTAKDLAEIGRKALKTAKENKGKMAGIPTGIGRLNRLTNGWKKGDLILLAGETGKGKTAVSLNFISVACMIHRYPSLYINSEMSEQQVMLRIGAMLSGVGNDKIKFGETDEAEDALFGVAMQKVEDAPILHYKSPSLELKNVVSVIRKTKIQNDVQFVVVDYVGRMDKLDDNLKEWQILELICKDLKSLAQELGIAVMVLAQLNDDQKLQGAKRMKNEADIFLKVQPLTQEQQDQLAVKYPGYPLNYQIWVEKNRDGISEVSVPVQFVKSTLRLLDVANVSA